MKLVIKDFIVLVSSLLLLLVIKTNINSNQSISENYKLFCNEVINILPFFGIICLGFYAALKISINISFINDCEKEYDELITELKSEEEKLRKLKLIN